MSWLKIENVQNLWPLKNNSSFTKYSKRFPLYSAIAISKCLLNNSSDSQFRDPSQKNGGHGQKPPKAVNTVAALRKKGPLSQMVNVKLYPFLRCALLLGAWTFGKKSKTSESLYDRQWFAFSLVNTFVRKVKRPLFIDLSAAVVWLQMTFTL